MSISLHLFGAGLMVVILIIGSVGTITILVLLQRNRSTQDVSFRNLIHYVTLSDLAVVLGACIMELKFDGYVLRWPYGEALCRIRYLLPEMVFTINSFLLVMLAVEGVLTVTRTVLPMKPKMYYTVIIMSVLAVLVSIPQCIVNGCIYQHMNVICGLNLNSEGFNNWYRITYILLAKVFPIVALGTCACVVIIKGIKMSFQEMDKETAINDQIILQKIERETVKDDNEKDSEHLEGAIKGSEYPDGTTKGSEEQESVTKSSENEENAIITYGKDYENAIECEDDNITSKDGSVEEKDPPLGHIREMKSLTTVLAVVFIVCSLPSLVVEYVYFNSKAGGVYNHNAKCLMTGIMAARCTVNPYVFYFVARGVLKWKREVKQEYQIPTDDNVYCESADTKEDIPVDDVMESQER